VVDPTANRVARHVRRLTHFLRMQMRVMFAVSLMTVGGLAGLLSVASPARADNGFTMEAIVAANGDALSTIVINGSNLPVAPASDIGEETGSSGIVEVADDGNGETCFFTCGWDAGYNDDSCEVTIGESTASQMILGVGDEGATCLSALDDSIYSGDNITVTLYNSDQSTYASETLQAIAPGTAPSVSSVVPPYGPEGGGTNASPGTGSVTVASSNVAAPEAFWFGSTGVTTDLFGVATTNFTSVGSGAYTVVPPEFLYGGDEENDGVSVLAADAANGMSQVSCSLEISGCNDEYLYLDSDSGGLTVPNLNGFELTEQISSFSDAGNACGQTVYNNESPGGSVTANFSGGPIDVAGNFGTSDSDSGLPEALYGSMVVTVESPITISISANLAVGGCLEVPYPDLALPDGLGGLYFVVGGEIDGSVTLTVTIDQGSYTITGGFIPGSQPADIGGATVTTNCVDANNNPTTDCVTTALSASLSGTVVLAPLWLSFGPSQANVGAGLLAAATGTITWPPQNGQTTDYDVCAGGLATAQIGVGGFSASYSYPWAGPINLIGDGSICPIGSISSPSSPVSNTDPPTLSAGPYTVPGSVSVTSPGTWTTPDTNNYTYQWEDCTSAAGTSCTNIDLATGPSYTLGTGDLNQYVGVIVTDTDTEGDTGTATVVSTSPVGSSSSAAPVVTKVSPHIGTTSGDTPITITGRNFVSGATVVIGQGDAAGTGALSATDVQVVSPTEITADTPGGAKAGSWHVFVVTLGGTSPPRPGAKFTYYASPVVTAVSPGTGAVSGDTPITITGRNFVSGATVVIGQGDAAGTGALSATDVQVVSPTEITADTPGGAKAGSWHVFVVTLGGTSPPRPGARFTYTRA
jgi:IPT/TIG domain